MKNNLDNIQTLEAWKELARASIDAADENVLLKIESLTRPEAGNLARRCADLCKRHAPLRGSNPAVILDAQDYIEGHSTWYHGAQPTDYETAYWKLTPAVMAIQEAVATLCHREELPQMNLADRALEAIEDAYPNWITASEIAKKIGHDNPSSIRASLSRTFKEIPPPYESDPSGAHLGYRWGRNKGAS